MKSLELYQAIIFDQWFLLDQMKHTFFFLKPFRDQAGGCLDQFTTNPKTKKLMKLHPSTKHKFKFGNWIILHIFQLQLEQYYRNWVLSVRHEDHLWAQLYLLPNQLHSHNLNSYTITTWIKNKTQIQINKTQTNKGETANLKIEGTVEAGRVRSASFWSENREIQQTRELKPPQVAAEEALHLSSLPRLPSQTSISSYIQEPTQKVQNLVRQIPGLLLRHPPSTYPKPTKFKRPKSDKATTKQ